MTEPLRVGINGFGRIGRLALRAGWDRDDMSFVHVNELHGDATTCAHLLEFDSVHGRWARRIQALDDGLAIDDIPIGLSRAGEPDGVAWRERGVDVVLECTGRFRTEATLAPYFDRGVSRVVVAAPVPDDGALNVVLGVNDDRFDTMRHRIVTAASCTTNCLAPIVKVLHEGIGIRHGSITTLHDLTNTQTVLDAPHRDLRRARAASLSLIPTTTGSATAIGLIFPELEGRLDGLAVRVPLANASLTDCVFEVGRADRGRGQRAAARGGGGAPRGHPRLRGAAARVGRLPGRPALGDRGRALDEGRRRDTGQGARLVRQRVGLCQPARRAGCARRGCDGMSTRAVDARGDRRNYAIVTGAYWADTVTDGAIRTLVLFYFYERGYSPFEVASLFLFYELFGVITNLVGGWLAARLGLKTTLVTGLAVQVAALLMLGLAPSAWLIAPFVMASQALSGIAKDLTKMSSKSAVRLVVPAGANDTLFRWVAMLTGSKNALKGVGFFLGGLLLTLIGFRASQLVLASVVSIALVLVLATMRGTLGTPDRKARFGQMFSNDRAVNVLAAARVLLFASRDVWFVVGLPVFLEAEQGWSFWQTGAFLAVWVIGYGVVQASAPRLLQRVRARGDSEPTGRTAMTLAFALALFPAAIALGLSANLDPTATVVLGLIAFGVAFALNSAVHSYLILRYAHGDRVAMNVGFYYTANALGRLGGTILSGLLYQWRGLDACLWVSVAFVLGAGALSLLLPRVAPSAAPAVI